MMDQTGNRKREFVGYEYKEVCADKNQISFLIDGYENFGWEVDGNVCEKADAGRNPQFQNKRILHLKRNRMELTRLQRNFEACVNEIEALEKAKTSKATMRALTVGIVGTAFMAGATFAVTADPPHIILCIILAIPAFIGWILPYFIYRKTAAEETEKMNRLIEEKYDEIYAICEKGNRLL